MGKKGVKIGTVTFVCPNLHCNRKLTRSFWRDGTREDAFAICNCGAQLLVSKQNNGVNISWINKQNMPYSSKCFVCGLPISPGQSIIIRGIKIHKTCKHNFVVLSVKSIVKG